jgi:hypothetical protein
MNEWLKGWLASESATHDKIEVKRIYIDLNEGNLFDGVIFSQIMYWHGVNRENGKPRMSIERDGVLWLAKGYGDWFTECRIVEATARKSLNRIANRGLIVKKLWKFNGAPTIHIRIDWDQLEEQLKLICPDVSNGFDTRGQIGIDTTGQIHPIRGIKSLTDTTASTTTETKSKRPRAASKKKDLTELEVWQRRLQTVEPIAAVLLAKLERNYDPAFNTPETYMTLSLLKKYVPYAEELTFLKMTPELLLSLCGEIEPEYKRQNWTFALKTIGEKAPSFMVRQSKKPVTLPPLTIVPPPEQPVEPIAPPEERQRLADAALASFLAPRQAVGE